MHFTTKKCYTNAWHCWQFLMYPLRRMDRATICT
jgi:hypothetical protein